MYVVDMCMVIQDLKASDPLVSKVFPYVVCMCWQRQQKCPCHFFLVVDRLLLFCHRSWYRDYLNWPSHLTAYNNPHFLFQLYINPLSQFSCVKLTSWVPGCCWLTLHLSVHNHLTPDFSLSVSMYPFFLWSLVSLVSIVQKPWRVYQKIKNLKKGNITWINENIYHLCIIKV